MDNNDILHLLSGHPLFQELTSEEIRFIATIAEIKTVPKGALILTEGQPGRELYLILEGEVEILKKDPASLSVHRVSVLRKGEPIGEMALIDRDSRSASTRALQDTKLISFPLEKLSLQPEQKATYAQILFNLSKILSRRLRKMDEITVKSFQSELEKQRAMAEMGRFMFTMFIALSSWIFIVDGLHSLASSFKMTSPISFSVISIGFLVIAFQAKTSIYPLSFFGLTLHQWKRNAIEALLLSLPILIVCTLVKWFLVEHHYIKDSVIKQNLIPNEINLHTMIPFIYLLFVPFQEFLSRGVLQSSLRAALFSKHTAFFAIFLSSLIFSAFHNFVSFYYAIAAFLGGLFWGWLYERQKSLVGPVVSHLLVGWWVLEILGVGRILTGKL
jgi:hypothetical protein